MLQNEALRLPVEDRLELAQALWSSLEEDLVGPALTGLQRALLDERIARDDAAPEAGSPWPEVRKRILAHR